MKILVSIFLALISYHFASAQINQVDEQGRKQGKWIKFYPNSQVAEYQITFKNDKPIGTAIYNYESNEIKAVLKYSQNSNRAEAYMYYENGKLMSHGIYINQQKDSIWTSFDDLGRITMKESYKNNKLNGQKSLYYLPDNPEDRSEIVISIYNFVNGQVEGEFVEYYPIKPSKKLRKTGQYKNHRRHGEWIYYDIDGDKISVEHYQDGKKYGWFIGYDSEGKEAQRRYFHYNRLVQGEELEKLMQKMKAKGIHPNGEE